MYKRVCLIFILLIAVLTFPISAYSQSSISININGKRINPDSPPYIKDSRTLVPIRGIFEEFGASIEWLPEQQRVNVKYKDKDISLTIGSNAALINNSFVSLDVPPEISSNRTMVPLRFIAENIGMAVQWVPEGSLVTITDPSYFSSLTGKTVLGFTTKDYSTDTGSYDTLVKNASNITSIAAFSYQIDNNGRLNLTGLPQNDAISFCTSKGIKPLMLIHNFSNGKFDRNISHSVLQDRLKRQTLINNIVITMSKEGYSGVNVDIENLGQDDRDSYSAFIRELKEKLTPFGFLTTACVPAKAADAYRIDYWAGAFDYANIGKYADMVVVMTYDEHYFGGEAGPIASLPWVESVVKYAVSTIPSYKVLLGIPAYGYDWSATGNKAVTYKNANNMLSQMNISRQWDDTFKSPFFTYTKAGVSHTVWYEDSSSLSFKLPLVGRYNLGGVGIWRLGYDNEDFWTSLRSGL